MLNIIAFCLSVLLANVALASGLKFDRREIWVKNAIRGELVEYSFQFTNRSKKPVKIVASQSDCGCVVADLDKNKLWQPAAKGVIMVHLDTTRFVGELHKKVVLLTDSEEHYLLHMRVQVREEFSVTPPMVFFSPGKLTSTLKIHREAKTLNSELDLKLLRCDKSLLRCKLSNRGRYWELVVKRLTSDSVSSSVKIASNAAVLKNFEIPVRSNDKVGEKL